MRIGIIGAGGIGQAFAKRLATCGIDAVISNSHGPESLTALVRQLGPHISPASTVEAAQADMVMVAVPWSRLPEALSGLPAWEERIVIDPTNPLIPPNFHMAELHGRTSSEVVADLVPGARLVKAFNTLPPSLIEGDPREGGGRRVLFYAGDDSSAKIEVGRLIEQLGFAGVDLGGLVEGGKFQQFPGGPLPALNLILLR
jgi:8-hydroxy-5-deazaflavin:NADPH oxidoreductase